jgi:hypothetical protein
VKEDDVSMVEQVRHLQWSKRKKWSGPQGFLKCTSYLQRECNLHREYQYNDADVILHLDKFLVSALSKLAKKS